MAVIPGHIKNETVIVGCHRDGEYEYNHAALEMGF